jgi:Flp pilus assembly pilin Flp
MLLGKLLRDSRGGEMMEYVVIAGLIIVVAIAVAGTIGSKVFGEWRPEGGHP